MKYLIQVENQTYTVEIKDINARPIIAIVDGTQISVWPDEISAPASPQNAQAPRSGGIALPTGVESPPPSGPGAKIVRAPIPGLILSIAVKPGDEVAYGQELCTLEAMKMRNLVRSSRAGRIAAVHASAGQTVNHHDPLVEFED